MINTIIFDIGNVMTRFAWDHFSQKCGYSEELIERIGAASIHSKAWDEFDRGVLSYEEVLALFVEKEPELKEEFHAMFDNMHGIVERVDYAIPWIEELKARGYRVLVLSNFPEYAHKDCMDALDFLPHTDGGILSYQDQVIKPNPECYQLLIDRYKLETEKCVFLDDREENLNGAKPFGIRTILFENYEQARRDLDRLLEATS